MPAPLSYIHGCEIKRVPGALVRKLECQSVWARGRVTEDELDTQVNPSRCLYEFDESYLAGLAFEIWQYSVAPSLRIDRFPSLVKVLEDCVPLRTGVIGMLVPLFVEP